MNRHDSQVTARLTATAGHGEGTPATSHPFQTKMLCQAASSSGCSGRCLPTHLHDCRTPSKTIECKPGTID